jgi:hypothetical protein
VDYSEIRVMQSRYTSYYFAEIGAMYLVNGKDYHFKHPYARKANITPFNAEILISNYPPGRGVTVSHHPKNPRRAWVDEWDPSITNQQLKKFKEKPEVRSQLSRRYKSRMLSGAGWLIGGISATVAGTIFLSQFGFAYIAFTGAIAYGLILFVSGLFGWLWNMD